MLIRENAECPAKAKEQRKHQNLKFMKKMEISQMENLQGGTGQSTANCINDWYSNHGWTSVLLWCTSALDPAVALTVAAACAVSS
jgi:hypothetical protein